jgi:hypothetical protein
VAATADHELSCRELSRLSTAFLDGALTPRLRATFEQHVLLCPLCVAHLDQVRVARDVLASLGDVRAPERTVAAVREAGDG